MARGNRRPHRGIELDCRMIPVFKPDLKLCEEDREIDWVIDLRCVSVVTQQPKRKSRLRKPARNKTTAPHVHQDACGNRSLEQ
jgi:hypothetical protein